MKITAVAFCLVALGSEAAFALPDCEATITIRGDQGTAKHVTLVAKDPAADPAILEAEAYGVSVAVFAHKDGTVDAAMTPSGSAGTYARGLMISPGGLTIDSDNNPGFEVVLGCRR
jgi:hypothetical protein